jgi:hypothetical protein
MKASGVHRGVTDHSLFHHIDVSVQSLSACIHRVPLVLHTGRLADKYNHALLMEF